MTVDADDTAGDGDIGRAARGVLLAVRGHAGILVIDEIAHRTVGAAAIDIMVYVSRVADGDVGVALDKAEPDVGIVTEAAAIDVAVGGPALPGDADGAAADGDGRVAAHLRQFAAAIDTLADRALGHCDGGVAADHSRVDIGIYTLAGTEHIVRNQRTLHGCWLVGDGSAHLAPHGDRIRRTDVDCGVALDIGLLAAAIDIRDGAQSRLVVIGTAVIVAVNIFCIVARNHVDVHRGIAVHHGPVTQTAAEGIADAGARDDVQDGVAVELAVRVCRSGRIHRYAVGE